MSNLLKWSGSKSTQAKKIIEFIPKDIINYYEPFLGGGSVFLELLENNKHIENYYLSDINNDLIMVYLLIKDKPNIIIDKYNYHYDIFSKLDFKERKEYFFNVKKQFNINRNPEDFYWIMRTTTNGMPRYNRKKEFNSSCHFTRPGMSKVEVEKLIIKYNLMFSKRNISFKQISYNEICFEPNSIIYLDPPYQNTKGMYFGNFDNLEFINWANNSNFKWILSYDGKVNNLDINHVSPNFIRHEYLISGNSSFRRIVGNTKDSIIKESLYLNY